LLNTMQPQLNAGNHLPGAFLMASALLAAVGYATVTYQPETTVHPAPKAEKVDVTFVEKIEKPAPPPAPPPKPEPQVSKAPPSQAPAPVVPKHLKKVNVDQPLKVKKLAAPTKVKKMKLAEADPSKDKGVKVYGSGPADPAGREGGGGTETAMNLPDNATPPRPLNTNADPMYPQAAKSAGKTGIVILKVVIGTRGRVEHIQVLRGEAPFVESAVEAVKDWRYRPARRDGQPLRVYHIVKIPFRLTT